MARSLVLFVSLLGALGSASAADVGRVKHASGPVHIERAGARLPAAVDTPVRASDTVVTGADASVGITFVDHSRVAAGPNTTLVLQRYSFDQATGSGAFDAHLKRGTLAVSSGRIARQAPDAMKVSTSTLVLGVRGTEFLVHAE